MQVTVNETMLNHENQIKLKEKRIPFKAGDVLGMYFPENSIINYSKYNYLKKNDFWSILNRHSHVIWDKSKVNVQYRVDY